MLLRLTQVLCTLSLVGLSALALAQPSTDASNANNASSDTKSTAEAPEPPHYFRWVDAAGRTHFSDTPPTGKKAHKEALTSAPQVGDGKDVKRIYQRANNIMSPPPKPQPANGSWKQLPKTAPPEQEP